MAEARRQMELTPGEQAVVERLRMSPEDRQAEVEARRQERLGTLTPEQRQAEEDRTARIESMTPAQRRVYSAGQRLAGVARALRRDAAKGVSLADSLAAVEAASRQDVDWLVGEIKKAD